MKDEIRFIWNAATHQYIRMEICNGQISTRRLEVVSGHTRIPKFRRAK